MKSVLAAVLVAALAKAGFSAAITSVELNGNSYSNISKVYLGGSNRVIMLYPGGGTSATLDQLPEPFLESWGIGPDKQAAVRAAASDEAAKVLERAIQAGSFREVHGKVYDTRQAGAGWLQFRDVKVMQITSEGVLVDSNPNNPYAPVPILVRNLPNTIGDDDHITFLALPDGTFTVDDEAGKQHTVRAYDAGKTCERPEIPESVLHGRKAFDAAIRQAPPPTEAAARLPESRKLEVTGSGFFVSGDGYFITNDHVVRNGLRVKLKMGERSLPARVVREDAADDLALLKVDGQFTPLAVTASDAELGQEVFTIGFPDIGLQGTEPKYTDGRVSSLAGVRDDPSTYQISVPVQPGNSGGPLADTAGNVRGVVVARLDDMAALRAMGSLPQNVNYAIKGSVLREFLRQSPEVKMAPESAGSGSAVDLVRQAVAIVLVY